MFNQFNQSFPHQHPMYRAEYTGVPNMTSVLIHRLEMLEHQVSALTAQVNGRTAYQPCGQLQPNVFQQQPQRPTPNQYYPADGFDGEAFKREIEPFVYNNKCPSLDYPVLKSEDSRFNATVYTLYNAMSMVSITNDGKIYTSINNIKELPVTKSNYKNLGLHPLFVGIFDKLAELEKANVQSNGNVNVKDSVIDDTMILESILDLSGQRNISLTTITTLYSAYRWYQIFKTEDAFLASFKEAVVKYQAELRKIKVHTQPLIHALKNLEQAFDSLLPDDGSVDLSDVKQTAIHLTISTIKSLISRGDE